MEKNWVKGLLLCSALIVGGCSTTPKQEPAPVEKKPDYTSVSKPATPTRPAAPKRPPVSSAAQSLMDKAEGYAGQGDFDQALALLERAQRIDPNSGEVYLALVKVYTKKGDSDMASATAQRGMLYCSGSAQCNALRAYTP